MCLSHYLGVYISEVYYWRPLTFQLGGDAMGNAPTFLLAIDFDRFVELVELVELGELGELGKVGKWAK